jgi:hypothetical protein
MFGVVFLVALGVVVGELLRRARERREMEADWRHENAEFLRRLRDPR